MLQQSTETRRDFPTDPSLAELGISGSDRVSPSARLIRHLQLLWDRRRFLWKATLVSLVLGTILAFLLPREYQSTVQLMPPDPQSSSGAAAMLAALTSKAGSDGLGAIAGDIMTGSKTSGALFVGILGSRTLEDRIVQRFDLRKVYKVRLNEDARKELFGNTDVAEDRKSGIITINVLDRNPARAAAIAQAHVDELDKLVAELSVSAAHRERVFLEDRLKVVKQKLDDASQRFSQFASQNSAINIPEQGKAMVEAAATLQGELIAAESQLKGLEEIYTSNNPRVRSLGARVSELHKQLNALGGETATSLDGSKDESRSLYPSIRELPILGVTYADLLRDTKIQEAVYENLTQQYEMAKVQEAKEIPSVKVLDAASIPERKKFPPIGLIIFWCTLVGFAAACGWVLAEVRWQKLDSRDAGKLLAQEVFHAVNATLPWSPPNGSRVQLATHRVWTRLVHRTGPSDEAE